jgi:hypothetical protein
MIKDLKSESSDKSVIAGLIGDMHELLSLIPGFEISKIDRASNSVAHELARLGHLGAVWFLP